MALFAIINLNPLITPGQSVVNKLVSQTKEKYVSRQKYLFTTLQTKTNTRTQIDILIFILYVSFPQKPDLSLFLTSVHLLPPLCIFMTISNS